MKSATPVRNRSLTVAEGQGEGKTSIATEILYDNKKEVVLDNYQSHPVLLTEVRKDAKTRGSEET